MQEQNTTPALIEEVEWNRRLDQQEAFGNLNKHMLAYATLSFQIYLPSSLFLSFAVSLLDPTQSVYVELAVTPTSIYRLLLTIFMARCIFTIVFPVTEVGVGWLQCQYDRT